jgi:DNA-binding MarR family transcriptional regulator
MTVMTGDEALLGLARAVVGIATRAADELGQVSIVQLRALTILLQLDGANLAQLAEGMGVTVSTTSRLVDRLVTAGMVDRRRAEHSRREISLTLTDAGRATLDRYDELRLAGLHGVLDGLADAERGQVIDAFALFTAAAHESIRLPAAVGQQ